MHLLLLLLVVSPALAALDPLVQWLESAVQHLSVQHNQLQQLLLQPIPAAAAALAGCRQASKCLHPACSPLQQKSCLLCRCRACRRCWT
jgi:hypothetical protein